jgi:peptidoglycan/xylan/chitin deacetylase (PgdA/CDA1 family)
MLSVTPENFYEQVNYLKNNCALLDVEEFLEIKKSATKKIPKNSVVITFDDGYADNFYHALPIIESLGIQALFCICTGNIDTDNEFWWDRLENIFFSKCTPTSIEFTANEKKYSFQTATELEKKLAYQTIYLLLKKQRHNERMLLLKHLEELSKGINGNRATHCSMNSNELWKISVSKSAVVGAHTNTHTPLSLLTYAEQWDEIQNSKTILEKIIKKPVKHFSYPYGGKEDYNSDSVRICKELGFEMAFSNFQGHIYKHTSNFELPRFLVRNWTISKFKEKINSYFSSV